MELNKNNEQAINNAIINLLEKPDEQPEVLRPLFNRVARIQATGQSTEQAINQARQSLNELLNQRSKIIGSAETLYDLIKEQLPEDLVKKYGEKILTLKPDELSKNSETKG